MSKECIEKDEMGEQITGDLYNMERGASSDAEKGGVMDLGRV